MADHDLISSLDDTTGQTVAVEQCREVVRLMVGDMTAVLTQEQAAVLADAITLARTCAAGWEAEQDV